MLETARIQWDGWIDLTLSTLSALGQPCPGYALKPPVPILDPKTAFRMAKGSNDLEQDLPRG